MTDRIDRNAQRIYHILQQAATIRRRISGLLKIPIPGDQAMSTSKLPRIIAIALLVASPAHAGEVSPEKASLAVRHWLGRSMRPMNTSFRSAKTQRTRTITDENGKVLFHVVDMADGGFVVTSGDTKITPIIAFSDSGSLGEDADNPFYGFLRADLGARMSALETSGTSERSRSRLWTNKEEEGQSPILLAEKKWDELTRSEEEKTSCDRERRVYPLTALDDLRVEPLVQTAWGQSGTWTDRNGSWVNIFNYYTPQNCVCGCTATAVAQIMRYWKFPVDSVQSHTESCLVKGKERNMTMKGGRYDWDSMVLSQSDITDASQCEAIGRLTYDVGVASKMHWMVPNEEGGYGGSAADFYDATEGLRNIFGYASATYKSLGGATGNLADMTHYRAWILGSLNAGMPTAIAIKDAEDGVTAKSAHAVVLDGYGYHDSVLFSHINWGWNGNDACPNAWYNFFDGVFDTQIGGEYEYLYMCIANIHPTESGSVISGRVVDSKGKPYAGATVLVRHVASGADSVAQADAHGIWFVRTAKTGDFRVQASASSTHASGTVSSDVSPISLSSGNLWDIDLAIPQESPPPWTYSVSGQGATIQGGQPMEGAVTIPSSLDGYPVTAIGEGAFEDCKALEAITIPGSVAVIGTNAFANCTGLTSVTLSEGVASIATRAFADCTNLAAIAIPASVTDLAAWAFQGCDGLKAISVAAGNSVYKSVDGVVFSKDGSRLVTCPGGRAGSYSVPCGVTSVGEAAFFQCCGLTSLSIPAGVTNIERFAFGHCYGLTSLEVPPGITGIDDHLFRACHGLTSVTLPESVTRIGNSAFSQCDGLTSLEIPSGVTAIGYNAFRGCTGLTSMYLPDGLTGLGDNVFANCQGLQELSVPGWWLGTDMLANAGVPTECEIFYRTSRLPNLTGYTPTGWPAAVYLATSPESMEAATNVALGDSVYLNFAYTNDGNADAGAHSIRVTIANASGSELASWYWVTDDLPVNCYASGGGDDIREDRSGNVILTTAGRYTVTVALDVDEKVAESDETDNIMVLPFTVVLPTQTVTFDATGGTCATATKEYPVGGLYTNLPTAERADHDFAGWWTAASEGQQVTADTTVTTNRTRTLWAHWTPTPKPNLTGYKPKAWPAAIYLAQEWGSTNTTTNVWTGDTAYLNFCYGNFGDGAANSHRVAGAVLDAAGNAVTNWNWKEGRLGTNACRGVTNIEFSVAAAGRYTVVVTLDSLEALAELDESDNEIRLKFTALAAQTVTFDANGGTCEMETNVYAVGGKYDPLPTAERAEHDFAGWWTSADGGQQVTTATTVTTNRTRTLWAHWTPTPKPNLRAYKPVAWPAAIYLAQEWGSTNTTTNVWAGETAYLNFCYGNFGTGAANSHRVAGAVLDAAGNAITNWNWKEGRLGTNACRGVTNIEFSVAAAGRYTVVLTLDSLGSLDELDESDNEIRLKFTAEDPQVVVQQTVRFDANGGTCKKTSMTAIVGETYTKLATASWENHVFEGWFDAREGGNRVRIGMVVTAEAERTLYAHWKQQTIHFDANGGTSKKSSVTCLVGGTYSGFPACTWENHVFQGWYDAPEGGTRVKNGMQVTADSERTLYAHWKQQTVHFDANGGTCKKKSVTCVVGGTYTSLASASWEGRKFLGWFDARTGGNRVKIGMEVTADAERTLYAHWEQTVRFDANGGTCKKASVTCVIGETYTTLATATRAGYTFQGWYDAKEGGTRVRIGMTVSSDRERTLYARWKAKAAGSGLVISGFNAGGAPREDGARRVALPGAVLTFEAEAGCIYELQWAPALDGEWTTLRRWTAESDGEATVEVPGKPSETTGFYRLARPAANAE